MTDKVTMAAVWEELTEEEKQILTQMTGVQLGPLALTKLSTVLKAVIYRYHEKPEQDHFEWAIRQKQFALEMQKKIERTQFDIDQEYKKQKAMQSANANTWLSGKKWNDVFGI